MTTRWASAETRFQARYTVAENGCWIWDKPNAKGYGEFMVDKKPYSAHRWAYLQFVGAIPDGLVVDHLCHGWDRSCDGGVRCPHRACVNPSHLGLKTSVENVRCGVYAWRTECSAGHPYTPETTGVNPTNGRKFCKTCKNLRRRVPYDQLKRRPTFRKPGDDFRPEALTAYVASHIDPPVTSIRRRRSA